MFFTKKKSSNDKQIVWPVKIINQCATCNGACCKIFSLTFSKRDMFKGLFSKAKFAKDRKEKTDYLKSLLFLKDISSTPVGLEVKKHLGSHVYAYTCRMINKNGKCIVYKHRPSYCTYYDCSGIKQLAHMDMSGKFKVPVLNERPRPQVDESEVKCVDDLVDTVKECLKKSDTCTICNAKFGTCEHTLTKVEADYVETK